MEKKYINIIKLLVSASNYISSYEIATACAISQRSVRVEMNTIKKLLLSLNYTLVSEPSKGYKILENAPEMLSSLFDYLSIEEKQKDSLFPTIPIERGSYILKRLVESEDFIKIDELANELLSSRSTIVQNMQYIKQHIKDGNLRLVQKPNFGLKIIGDESSIRKLLCDLLFLNLNHSEMLYDFLDTFISNPDAPEYHIIEILYKYDISISDIGLCDFLLSLIININRITNEKHFLLEQDISIVDNRIEFEVAREICDYLSIQYNIYFNQDEITLVAIQLICKRSTKLISEYNELSNRISNHILEEIKRRTLLTFTNKDFINELVNYIEDSIIRLYFNEKIRTPIFESSSTIYPLGYELAKISSEIIEKYIHKKISSSELATYSIMFDTAISNSYYSKKKVLLVYNYSDVSAHLLKKKILQMFNNEIVVYGMIPYHKFHHEVLSEYDFIIATSPIHHKLEISCITISHSLSSIDIKKIDNHLKYYCKSLKLELVFHPQLFSNHIDIKSFKDLIHHFYLQISKMYPFLKELTFSSLFNSSHYDCSTFKNGICFLKIHKPIHTNTILSVIILENTFFYKDEHISTFILLSSSDESNYINNTIHNLLSHIPQRHDKTHIFNINSSYTEFLEIIKKIYSQNS